MVCGDILSLRPSTLEGSDSKHKVGTQTRKESLQPRQSQAKQGRQEANGVQCAGRTKGGKKHVVIGKAPV